MSELELADAIIAHALRLQQLSASQEAEADAILAALESELRALLASQELDSPTKRAVEQLVKQADDAIAARYADAAGVVDTHGLTVLVADNTQALMEQAFGSVRALTAERIASLSTNVLVYGSPARDWWAKQSEDTAFRFAAQVRQGVANGETQERIVARIVGRRGEPGVLDLSRRNARALVHSTVMAAANHARLAVYRKNMKHARGMQWLATLDSHTCTTCAALDGSAWDFDGNPLDGTTLEWKEPPAHWSCRCVLSPLPKSLNELLGMPGLDEMLSNTRASANGPISGDTSMTGFLKRNPATAEEILGAKRVAMFQSGKMTLRDFVSGTGRPLTLAELGAR